ncbi:MAG TPA: hypothetical protein PLZ57_04860 [Pseudobdellovibrionaceae bacterium]|nr:hypothetical protein [Pseudobdellovibrionaceae bacterium]
MNHQQTVRTESRLNNSLRAVGALVVAATLSWSGLAQAEVKPPGTVLPWMCAEARETMPRAGGWSINQVCMASIVGQAATGQGLKQFVVVHESRVAAGSFFRRQMVYEITQERTRQLRISEVRNLELLQIGSVSSQGFFQPKMTADHVVGQVRIQTSTRTGRTTASGVIDQRTFRTGEFEHIYHTMSVGLPQ